MKPTHIILHHSATADGRTFSWPAIRGYHTSWRANGRTVDKSAVPHLRAAGIQVEAPWRDIGYHFGIELIDKSVEILVGRMMDEAGAHCVGMNDKSLGLCFMGNYDLVAPPREYWDAGIRLVSTLMRAFGIIAEKVDGHRKYANKTCPGRMFDLEKFRNELKEV